MYRVLTILAASMLLFQPETTAVKITGLSHLAVYVSDLAAAREFYGGLLGLREEPVADGAEGSSRAIFRINADQYVELLTSPPEGEGQLHHVAFTTESADGLRRQLAARQIAVPQAIQRDAAGDPAFIVHDPDGHRIEFVEHRRASGPLPASSPEAISARAWHAGVLAADLEASQAFYTGVLGFRETWRGAAANSTMLSWVNLQVPDGTDYVELMLYVAKPAPDRRGSAHHLCLQVPDMDAALARIEQRRKQDGNAVPLTIRTGINRKRQLNLFDPDGTRVELMEPETVDGVPAPSSTLPPPRGR
jgi:lactoylglutathione lyase